MYVPLALDEGEWLASCPNHVNLMARAPQTHQTDGWECPELSGCCEEETHFFAGN
jgi:hypothetical protein